MTTLERVVSQKALKMGNSFSCQICVAGFLCGVCLTYFFLAALTSSGNVEFGEFSFLPASLGTLSRNSSSSDIFSNANTVQYIGSVERTVFYHERAAGMYALLPYAFAQVKFFGGYPVVEVLRKNMNELLGIDDEDDGHDERVIINPPWIQCCLKSHYLA